MKQYLSKLRALVSKALAPVRKLKVLAPVRTLWAKEPARVISVTVAVVVFVAAKLGVIVPVESVTSAVAFTLPILFGGELIRSQVTPTAAVVPAVVVPSDAPKV